MKEDARSNQQAWGEAVWSTLVKTEMEALLSVHYGSHRPDDMKFFGP